MQPSWNKFKLLAEMPKTQNFYLIQTSSETDDKHTQQSALKSVTTSDTSKERHTHFCLISRQMDWSLEENTLGLNLFSFASSENLQELQVKVQKTGKANQLQGEIYHVLPALELCCNSIWCD